MATFTRTVGFHAGPAYPSTAYTRLPLQMGRLVQCKYISCSTKQKQHLLNIEPNYIWHIGDFKRFEEGISLLFKMSCEKSYKNVTV